MSAADLAQIAWMRGFARAVAAGVTPAVANSLPERSSALLQQTTETEAVSA